MLRLLLLDDEERLRLLRDDERHADLLRLLSLFPCSTNEKSPLCGGLLSHEPKFCLNHRLQLAAIERVQSAFGFGLASPAPGSLVLADLDSLGAGPATD